MIKKTTYLDGRVEELSGAPVEIAEYDRLRNAPSLPLPEAAQVDIERWRKIFEEGLRQGPQCGEFRFSSVDGDPVDQTQSGGSMVCVGKTCVWVPGLQPFKVG